MPTSGPKAKWAAALPSSPRKARPTLSSSFRCLRARSRALTIINECAAGCPLPCAWSVFVLRNPRRGWPTPEMENTMSTLQDKNAVVFGAGGTIGAAVAKTFAAEGARVFLAGRTKAGLEALAKQISARGGDAHTAVVDVLDDAAVNQYIDGIVQDRGRIDIVLDVAGPLAKDYGNGQNAVDLPVDAF